MEGRFEKVYTMTDYYDGPRRGIADFEGKPHFYDSEWSDTEDLNLDTFKLTAITADLLSLALEDWAIWRRWETAFHEDRVDTTTQPALPEDRTRHDELRPILAEQLVVMRRPLLHGKARGADHFTRRPTTA
jgi:hypothetical protein